MSSYSSTLSASSTYTEARARKVMGKVQSDLIGMQNASLIAEHQVTKWVDDVLYCLNKEALRMFEFQLTLPDGSKRGIRYNVKDDGTISEDASTGGIDYYDLPKGTRVNLVIDPREGKLSSIQLELQARGWGFNGQVLPGEGTRDSAYSKDGYGLQRMKIGAW